MSSEKIATDLLSALELVIAGHGERASVTALAVLRHHELVEWSLMDGYQPTALGERLATEARLEIEASGP